jgi:2-succinyl-5-enolpyruvyl-6-hydroxy-3-cyclohexene-1-carboxylate synthase
MTPTRPEDVQATFCATLVDEWRRGGVRHAVVCPGSRSTPLALALAAAAASDRGPALSLHVHHDERSGAFTALGLALSSGTPVVVLTTSGTAAVELHPAVVEAHHAGVPLLVCTADRPPELRDVGAAQTIDQTHLYGGSVRWFGDPGLPDWGSASRWRPFAARALAETAGPPAGPVQVNLPFREPLVGTADPLLPEGRAGSAPWVTTPTASGWVWPDDLDVADLYERRGLIVAGNPCGDPDDVARVAAALDWPVVADPPSAAWGSEAPVSIAHLDAILRSDMARTALRPEVVLRLGRPPSSRVVDEWLAASGAQEIVVAGGGAGAAWTDPSATASVVVRVPPADFMAVLAAEVLPSDGVAGWSSAWAAAGRAAVGALESTLAGLPGPNEPGVARDVVAALPAGAGLVVSSSMPIRDVERYAAPRHDLRVFSNRGANGIDGVVSTAVGVALGLGLDLDGAPVGLLIGDVAFLHDGNGLLGAAGRGVDLVAVVVDNDGGGIFSFLPQARHLEAERFESLFGTPHGLDLVALAAAYGADARLVGDGDDLAAEVAKSAHAGGLHVLVVRTNRATNVDVHRRLDDAIATAVTTALS